MTFYKNLALIIDTELKANKVAAVKAKSITATIIENTVTEFGGKTLYLKGTSINCFYHGVYECNLLKLINTNFSKLNY